MYYRFTHAELRAIHQAGLMPEISSLINAFFEQAVGLDLKIDKSDSKKIIQAVIAKGGDVFNLLIALLPIISDCEDPYEHVCEHGLMEVATEVYEGFFMLLSPKGGEKIAQTPLKAKKK